MVVSCHMVPSRRKDQKRVIICTFVNEKHSEEILSKKKALIAYNKQCNDRNKTVYINEHLSPKNRKLKAMAMNIKYEKNYKFIWTKKGICFLRKDETSPPLKLLVRMPLQSSMLLSFNLVMMKA